MSGIVIAVGMVAFWTLLVLGVAALLRWMSGAERELLPKAQRERPLNVLDRRLSSGEITIDEYEQRKQPLDHHRPRNPTPA